MSQWGIELTFYWFTRVIKDERCKEKEESICEGITVISKYKMLYINYNSSLLTGNLPFLQLLTVFFVFFFFFWQVIFEGIAGYSFTGDIAIDSVKIIKGGCPGKNKPI